jgi:hypothetical protein
LTNPHHAAAAAITALRINGANLDVAQHWLSGWRHGQPPRLCVSTLDAVWQYKPAMMICRVVKDKSLACVMAGALLRLALGFDPRKRDLLALLPQDCRADELGRAWAISQGAITVRYRRFSSRDGHQGLCQGIALPFSGEDGDGGRHFLMHTNWRPVGDDWIVGNVDVELGNTSRREMISFMAEPADLPDVVSL